MTLGALWSTFWSTEVLQFQETWSTQKVSVYKVLMVHALEYGLVRPIVLSLLQVEIRQDFP